MPDYDFRCQACQNIFNLTYKSFSEYVKAPDHTCPKCESHKTQRVIGRVAIGQSQASRLDRLADSASPSNIDENDPKAVSEFMQNLGKELDSNIET